ncbi:pyridine nucleotide-disulfide oxidoreductase [Spiribacter sp. C176]|uniref:Pyridine nucleotide-disulfide oxidoreductase n=1 Tax=Spiribacter salilacus TaxID=2664894 RepID=A0A6N7QTS4_9GAMM|nr:FAD-dependent oxidoreductase [Spiribacter salilacus]MRH77727.1 pyridine nucleotide-disulfide oxidoreductase [Spiribacter salilacus]
MNLNTALARHGLDFTRLQTPEGLAELDALFLRTLDTSDATLSEALRAYRKRDSDLPGTANSELLLAIAPHLEAFIGDVFGIQDALDELQARIVADDVVMAFKQAYVQKRVKKHRQPIESTFGELDAAVKAGLGGGSHGEDEERAIAELAMALLDDADTNAEAIELITAWCKLARQTPEGQARVAGWASFRLPARVDPLNRVDTEIQSVEQIDRLAAPANAQRHRDGFSLTDARMDSRQVQSEVHYCIYCHDHEGDFCSRGFPEKKTEPGLGFKQDPLGVTLTGCPLEEKISEMHLLRREGLNLAALAMVMVDNPMVPATGHRICNDCMKGCIYQKQDPVNIPQIETRVLTDTLELPWGVELYHLLTRWNPLRREQYVQQPDNGRRVLVAGLGPAGFTIAHHLTMTGTAVVGIDGLKIEPLPAELLEQPVAHWDDLVEDLDERILLGFGGVAEYGITVRWDKNFLKLIYLTLARRHHFQAFGGVRLGGTLTLDDAWELGFDHVVNATGAGLPRVVPMGNSLARGMRQASDFLMALQLTGAAKASSLASLQVRLPAVVIGGGLTGIDTATEVQAYYIKQVEKILSRHEQLCERIGAEAVTRGMNEEDLATLDEFVTHGKAVRAERLAAARDGREPDFSALLKSWGGVTVAYRKSLTDSPAYTRNHEEVAKAMEEGLLYAEGLEPVHAEVDDYAHVSGLVCRNRETGETQRLSARAIFIAAGTVPNTIYEREHSGTFELDGDHFRPHELVDKTLTATEDAEHSKKPTFGPFTSYQQGGRRVSFIGDTHPAFHGSVVKAIASGMRTYPYVLAAMALEPAADTRSHAEFMTSIDDLLSARVVEVKRDNPAMIELWVRAPMAARNFKAGQFFRLQTYESLSPVVAGTRLQIPVITVSGTGVRNDCIRLMILQWGAGPRLVGRLQPGDPLVLMGPTGAPTDMPSNRTIMVVAGRWGAAVMLDIGAALRAAGNRVLYVAAFGAAADVDHQDELEAGADQIIWCTARGPQISARRPQDISLEATDMIDVVRRYAHGEIGPASGGIPLHDVDRIMVMGGTGLLQGFQDAIKGELKPLVAPNCDAFGTVGSPMQCMLQGVCAQCLQWQIDPVTGKRTRAVFSCAGQDQPLDCIDLENLAARQQQNRLSDRLNAQWLEQVLLEAPPVTSSQE